MNASTIAPEHAPFDARPLRLIGGAVLAMALGCLGLPASAATINVAAGAVAVANNSVCSLREAIRNANADAQVDNTDCPAGSGTDTLQLAAGSTYTLVDADPVSTLDGLPAITSTLVINGVGASIQRSSGLSCFLDGAQQAGEFRLLSIPDGGDATLNNLTLRNGCADGVSGQVAGGGIQSFGRLTLTQVLFEGNRSASSGGGLAAGFNNTISITSSTFSNNYAAQSAGAIFSNVAPATMTLSGTNIVGNAAGGEAGGILNRGSLTLVNSTVIGNTANDVGGGGISNANTGTLRLDAVTISANKANVATGGGGVRNQGTLTVKNSIIAGNFEGGDCVRVGGSFTALGKNLDSDGSCVALDGDFTRVTATQLALAPASFFAGGTRGLAPLFGSVAVDAVTDCTRIDGSTVNAVDQLGNNRPQDGDTTPGAACDIGAIERAPVGSVLNVSGGCTLGDAIAAANTDSTVGGCVDSGVGPDVLVLGANATLTTADTARSTLQQGAFAGLPDVTSEIVIAAGAGNVLERAPAANCATPDQSNEFRLLNVLGSGRLTLSGLTLRNGCADVGGAVFVADAKLAVIGGSFSGNTARSATAAIESARGGAIALDGTGAAGAFLGTAFSSNLATHSNGSSGGGAISTGIPDIANGGPIEVRDCTFTGNSASGGFTAGGAIAAAATAGSTIAGSSFSSNQANSPAQTGGGAVNGALAVLFNSRFVDNQTLGAPTDDGEGGAVTLFSEAPDVQAWLCGLIFERNRSSTVGGGLYSLQPLTLLRSRFSDNIARSLDAGEVAGGGGALLSNALISDVTFENNLAEGYANPAGNGANALGGGLLIGGQSRLTNVTFRGNRAIGGAATGGTGGFGRGGGLLVGGPTPFLNLLTLADNQAIAGTGTVANGTAVGGGLYAGAAAQVHSSLLEGNTTTVGLVTSASDCAAAAGDTLISFGFNSVGTPTNCSFGLSSDQVGLGSSLLALGDHGCSVKLPDGRCLHTMPVRITSPALDRSDCEGFGPVTLDARQFSRPIDIAGAPNAGNACDAGAYESRDGDADGVEDWVDNCPFVANPNQLDRDLDLGAPPVAIWRLDEGQGTAAGDGFGTHVGTLTGNPQWVSGIAGAALAFDGTGDGVLVPHNVAFNPPVGGNFSVTAWVKLPASQAQTGRTTNLIVGKDQEGGGGFPFPWVLRVFNQTAPAGAVGHLQGTRSDGTLAPQVISTSRIDDGRWHHAAYIKRGSMLEMWVDGVLEASATDTTTAAAGNTRQVGIGLREADSAKLDLRGSVDEVLYIASALTPTQVQELFQRRGLAGDGLGAACDCDDTDPTNLSAVCANLFSNGFE